MVSDRVCCGYNVYIFLKTCFYSYGTVIDSDMHSWKVIVIPQYEPESDI